MLTADLDAVVETHLSSFQDFFLSFLGKEFLEELYAGILADPSGLAFIAEQDCQVHGFVAGTSNPQGFYRRLLRRRWWRFVLASIGPAIRKPSIIPRLMRALWRGSYVDVHDNCATLMSIAVSPDAQGTGFGKKLVQVFLEESSRRGIKSVNLTTDRDNNEPVNRFYVRIGFRLNSIFKTPDGRRMNEYIIEHL
jgi:ribosomal protein S18 acetylase RimI-like enzyme